MDARSFTATLVHDKYVAEDIFGPGDGRFIELPIGVDFDHFRPGKNYALREKLGVKPDDVVFIYTGAIMPIRRLDHVIDALGIALRSNPDLHLMLVGWGSDASRLKQAAEQLGINSRVHFIGLVAYQDMPAVMHAADIGLGYVPQDTWYDKAPVLKTMESLASGLPTIATNTRGNQKYIVDGVNGLLVGDKPEQLAEGMLKLASSRDLRRQFSNGREHIVPFQWKYIVEDILEPTYAKLVSGKQLQPG